MKSILGLVVLLSFFAFGSCDGAQKEDQDVKSEIVKKADASACSCSNGCACSEDKKEGCKCKGDHKEIENDSLHETAIKDTTMHEEHNHTH